LHTCRREGDSWPVLAGRGAGQRDPKCRAAPYWQHIPAPARGAGPRRNHGRPCEGVFAWVTANYLVDSIRADSPKTAVPYAVLDLGSMLTQIVFGDGPQLLNLYIWICEPFESASTMRAYCSLARVHIGRRLNINGNGGAI